MEVRGRYVCQFPHMQNFMEHIFKPVCCYGFSWSDFTSKKVCLEIFRKNYGSK